MENSIKKFIVEKKKENKHHTLSYLSDAINVNRNTLIKFFKSKKGSIEIADKLLNFYNAEIITKEL